MPMLRWSSVDPNSLQCNSRFCEPAKERQKAIGVGAVGYAYNQLTGDSGSGAKLGPFKSRVEAIGPQLGYIFPVGEMQGVLNLKGYWEFDAQNRAKGWNTWLTFAVSAPPPPLPAGIK